MALAPLTSCVIFVIEEHHQLLELWKSLDVKKIRLIHFDFHCDMRGLLVDKQKQVAYKTTTSKLVDEGNFITHAIFEGHIDSIHWIHPTPGGRKFDVGTVMYMTDMSMQPKRCLLTLNKHPGLPIHYQVTEFEKFDGVIGDSCIDIDWDFFAAKDFCPNSIEERVEAFFNKLQHYIPKEIYVCYSPRYSHPSREQFKDFVNRLAALVQAEIVQFTPLLQSPASKMSNIHGYNKFLNKLRYQFKHLHYETTLWLRKMDIY